MLQIETLYSVDSLFLSNAIAQVSLIVVKNFFSPHRIEAKWQERRRTGLCYGLTMNRNGIS
jgi:hypothetical protein